HALALLSGLSKLRREFAVRGLADAHPGVRRYALRLAEGLINDSSEVLNAAKRLTKDSDPLVRLQLSFTLGACKDQVTGELLGTMLFDGSGEEYLRAAVLSSISRENLPGVLQKMMEQSNQPRANDDLFKSLLTDAAVIGDEKTLIQLTGVLTKTENETLSAWQ